MATIARPGSSRGRRLLLLLVAGLLCAAAALAIGILLFGGFGRTEGRILGTTALLAGCALLALPAAILVDQRRLPLLAGAVVVLAASAAALSVAAIWTSDPPEALGKAVGTADGWLVVATQVAALAARRRAGERRLLRGLFVVSTVLGVVLASLLTVVLWAEIDAEAFARLFAALVVLDVLVVALQPLLARARREVTAYRFRIGLASGASAEIAVDASDLATAIARAIQTLERSQERVRVVEIVEAAPASAPADAAPPRDDGELRTA